MTKEEALTKALNQLKRADQIIQSLCPQGYIHPALCSIHGAIVNVQEALAQPEQEPVAWICEGSSSDEKHAIDYWPKDLDAIPIGTMLYTHPPQRTWVELTLQDKQYLNEMLNLQGRFPVIDAIEAKLKERNT